MSRFNPLLLKMLTVGAVMLLLWIPLSQVESLITERSNTRAGALERVASGSGHQQQIGAAILVVPVTRTWSVNGKAFVQVRNLRMLADDVTITGRVSTETRRSGIYRIPTFQATLNMAGSLPERGLQEALTAEPGVAEHVGRPRLFVAISDPAAIRLLDGIRVDGILLPASAATESGLSGISVDLPAVGEGRMLPKTFNMDIAVSGTERLQWLPLADSTTVKMSSAWPDPAFSGSFAPQKPNVTDSGFIADWRVLQINRNFPQRWIDDEVSEKQITNQAFGVDFYQPVDTYQRNYRAIHYALLFIALTFMSLFLWEHVAGKAVHPMQYAMTGFALAVFYLFLLALSEHVSFGSSYAIASSIMAALLGFYRAGVFASVRAGALAGAMIATCYCLLYWLVLSADYALLCGTLALLLLLAGIMAGTRRFDWYVIAARARDV